MKSEKDTWLAGLLAADGCFYHGAYVLDMKPAAGRVLARLGEVRQVWRNGRQSSVLVRLKGLPGWSRSRVPVFPFLSDLERHYWRGVIDGDGSIRLAGLHRDFLYLEFYWNVAESYLRDAFVAFLSKLGIKFKEKGTSSTQCRGVHLGTHDSVALARWLYEGAEYAMPWKQQRALEVHR